MPKDPVRRTGRHFPTTRPFTRRDFLSTSLKVGAAAFTTGVLPKPRAISKEQYNVVFIVADDLRPLLGCYGDPEIQTPNIDWLAEQGTLFNRAYCQYPLCKPSRTSMLTGLRPDTNGIRDNHADFRQTVPDSDVYIHIYNLKGESIQCLKMGFQAAGTYRTRSRAAYWDGRNVMGEPVSSGVYFYMLQAGQIKITRPMAIVK